MLLFMLRNLAYLIYNIKIRYISIFKDCVLQTSEIDNMSLALL